MSDFKLATGSMSFARRNAIPNNDTTICAWFAFVSARFFLALVLWLVHFVLLCLILRELFHLAFIACMRK